jgi:hypothetical protein
MKCSLCERHDEARVGNCRTGDCKRKTCLAVKKHHVCSGNAALDCVFESTTSDSSTSSEITTNSAEITGSAAKEIRGVDVAVEGGVGTETTTENTRTVTNGNAEYLVLKPGTSHCEYAEATVDDYGDRTCGPVRTDCSELLDGELESCPNESWTSVCDPPETAEFNGSSRVSAGSALICLVSVALFTLL